MSELPTIGGYQTLKVLGQGGQATVFLAERLDSLGQRVALKVFPPAEAERFQRELATYRAIEAARREQPIPELVTGLASGELPDGGGYVALSYQAGGTLAERVVRDGTLPPEEATRLVNDVLRGLECLHGLGLYHRDVKPQNVLLTERGALLGDFGLAGALDASVSSGGTPAFAAPEQWVIGDDRPRDGVAIDVYGAAATLYFVLTGRSPLPGAPDVFVMEGESVPRHLQDVILRALDPQPAQRFPNVVALRHALTNAPQPTPPAPKLALWLGALAVLGLLVWAVLPTPPSDPRSSPGQSVATPDSASESSDSASALSDSANESPDSTSDLPDSASASPDSTSAFPDTASESPASTSELPVSGVAPDGPVAAEPRTATGGTTASRVETEQADDGTAVYRVGPAGRELLCKLGPGPVRWSLLHTGSVLVGHASLDGLPLLHAFSADGKAAHHELAHPLTLLVPDSRKPRAALGLSDGSVWVVEETRPPRRVGGFAFAVVSLAWEEDSLSARGDQRTATLLGPDAQAPPGSRVVEGSEGRYAFPREPQLADLSIPLP